MAAFGGQHAEYALVRDDTADSESRTHAEDGADALLHRQGQTSRADGLQVRGAQRAHGVTHGFEVVDDAQLLEALRLAERTCGKRPAAVGELHTVCIDAARDRDGGTLERRRNTRRGVAIVMRGVRDGFVRADRVAAHAMHVEGVFIGTGDGDAEPDVSAADIGHETQHRGVIEMFSARDPRWKAPYCPSPFALFRARGPPESREDCATPDSAVNRMDRE